MIRFALVFAMLGGMAIAQSGDTDDVAQDAVRAATGGGAMIRGLDKLNWIVTDLEMTVGETRTVGRLDVLLGECRYPEDNPGGEAYAWLEISDPSREAMLFQGWMIASSPALNALDHPRYDIWVIRCQTA